MANDILEAVQSDDSYLAAYELADSEPHPPGVLVIFDNYVDS
jgi:hypothetical protein